MRFQFGNPRGERVAIGLAVEAELGNRRGSNQYQVKGELVQNFAQAEAGQKTREIAADKAGFGSEFTYRQAKTVVQNASPELVEAMDNGSIAISTAARLVDALVEVQQRARQACGQGGILLRANLREAIGARLKSLFEEQAKKRQQAGGANGGSVKPLNNQSDKVEAQVPQPSRDPQSRDLAGDSVNVGAKVIDRADKVIKQGAPTTAPRNVPMPARA